MKDKLERANDLLNIQKQEGNYNYDPYMLGMFNGMELIVSIFEDREPNYISGKDITFINDKNQQLKQGVKELKEMCIKILNGTYMDSTGGIYYGPAPCCEKRVNFILSKITEIEVREVENGKN